MQSSLGPLEPPALWILRATFFSRCFVRCSVTIGAMEERRSLLGRYEYIAPCEEGGAVLSLM
jgi:hypothetical protein